MSQLDISETCHFYGNISMKTELILKMLSQESKTLSLKHSVAFSLQLPIFITVVKETMLKIKCASKYLALIS